MRRLHPLLAAIAAASVTACHSNSTDPTQRRAGTDSFLSQPPDAATAGVRSAAGGTVTAGAAGAALPSAAPAAGDSAAAATRTVEEADIYKQDEARGLLFLLNSYRGLQIVDVSNPSAPRLLSQVHVTGRPVDLYVRGQTALVAVSDVFVYYALADGSVQPHRGSHVLAIDVTDAGNPAVVADLPIEGDVQETRRVGDVLYVVSRKYAWYDWSPLVASAGGGAVASPGSATAGGATTGVAVAAGMPIAPGSDTVFVASFDIQDPAHPSAVSRVDFQATGWDTHANVTDGRVTLSFAGYGPSASGAWVPSTQFRVIDISDPGGALTLGTTFSADGAVRDRWGMDFDEAKQLFRSVVDKGSNTGAALDVWYSPDVATATDHRRLEVNVAESLTAARFDGDRVYVVTALRTDPLFLLDTSDRLDPKRGGEVHMPGQLDFIEPLGDRLVALGHTDPTASTPFQLAVSLFDVSNLAQPALLQTPVTFGSSWGWVSASKDDLQKAFIVLPPPPDGIGLVIVPIQGWDRTTYRYAGGTQLITLGRDTLTLQGFLQHPGQVTRSFPLDSTGARLAALSDSALQVIDASDRSAPVEIARLDLARSVATLAIVHGKAVELSGDWATGVMELAVTDALDPDAATPLARVDLAAPQARTLQDGDVLWVLAHDDSNGASWLQGIDVHDPAAPAKRGRLDLDAGESFGYGRWWGFSDEAVLVGHALAIHHTSYLCYDVCPAAGVTPGEIRVYDLSDPDHPRRTSTVPLSDAAWAWGLSATGSFLWLTHYEWNTLGQDGRYYLDRIDLSDPAEPKLLPKINVPGIFFAASADGKHIYTLESAWQVDHAATSLRRLALGATAVLEASVELDGYPSGSSAAGGDAWVVVHPSASDQPAHLVTVDLVAMGVASDQAVQGSWAWLRTAAGGKLFLDGGWNEQGLLIYDVADPAHPAFEQFFPTPSWVWDVVVADGRAYLPSGPYGVPVVTLR